MKYIITENQYKKLLSEEVISVNGFVRIANPDKVGILAPDGSVREVERGTKIIDLHKIGELSIESFTSKDWVGTYKEDWMPIGLEHMTGVDLGLGPTVGSFIENGTEFVAVWTNPFWKDEKSKPKPDMWKFNNYYAKGKKKEEGGLHKGKKTNAVSDDVIIYGRKKTGKSTSGSTSSTNVNSTSSSNYSANVNSSSGTTWSSPKVVTDN